MINVRIPTTTALRTLHMNPTVAQRYHSYDLLPVIGTVESQHRMAIVRSYSE